MYPLLKGVRVLDLTAIILGPFATQILGDLGAEVIKVEPPEGEGMRPIAPVTAGLSAVFANNNRNKRSVVLDLKSAAGRKALAHLVPTADIFVHNMRQKAMDKLGFGFDAVRALNPRAIYAAAVGFGSKGRYAGKPAFDDVIQAASGFAGLFEVRDGVPIYAPSIAADKVSGLHLVYAVLAALFHRERTGEAPGYIEVPMYEAMAAFNLCEHLGAATFEQDGKVGYQRVMSTDRRPYATSDGWVGVLPYSTAAWTRMLKEIGRADIIAEPWFQDVTERSRRVDQLYAVLAEALKTRTTKEWLEILERLDIPSQPVRRPADLLSDPHLDDVGFFTTSFAADTPVVRTLRQPVTVDGVTKEPDVPPPLLGADTAAVLREAGLAEADIAAALDVKAAK